MPDLTSYDTKTTSNDTAIEVFRCNCGKEFNVTGYPADYKFACPGCHAFCTIKDQKDELNYGMVLGDFIVEKKIGEGGMGIVYQGKQLSLERPVAIKVLKANAANNKGFIQRFSKEAKTAAQIIHNNIAFLRQFSGMTPLERLQKHY